MSFVTPTLKTSKGIHERGLLRRIRSNKRVELRVCCRIKEDKEIIF